MRWVSAGLAFGALVLFSCGGDVTRRGHCAVGSEGCVCHEDETCDAGLSCDGQLCQAAGASAGGGSGSSHGGAPVVGGVGPGASGADLGEAGSNPSPQGGASVGGDAPFGGAGGDAGGVGGDAGGVGGEAPLGGAGGEGGEGWNPDEPLITHKLHCGSRDVTGATVASGDITRSTRWSGVVHVTADVRVKGATLTIQPGTKIIVAPGANIELGLRPGLSRLVARGTALAPISFCGENDQAGTWGSLRLHALTNPESVLQNVLVDGGGLGGEGALRLGLPALVRGVQLQHSAGRALAVFDFLPGSDRVTIYTPTSQPVQFLSLRAATNFPDNSAVNAEPSALTTLTLAIQDSNFSKTARLRDLGLPYLQTDDVRSNVPTPPKVTFEAGVVYELPVGQTLSLYNHDVEMLGTPERPVRIQGPCAEAACSSGGGRVWLGHAKTTLENVVLAGLGSAVERGVTIEHGGVLSIQNVRVENSGSAAVLQLGAEVAPGSSGLVVRGSSEQRLELTSWDALRALPVETQVPNGDRVAATFSSIITSGTLKSFPFDVRFRSLAVYKGTLTVEPGARLRFSKDALLRVYSGATLSAVGTAEAPILLSQVENSGEYWSGISVDKGASATLDHVIVEHGGGLEAPGSANISAAAPISLQNSLIRGSLGYGLSRRATDTTDYTLTNTFTGNQSGALGTF